MHYFYTDLYEDIKVFIYAYYLLAVSVRNNIIQLLSTGIIYISFSNQNLKRFFNQKWTQIPYSVMSQISSVANDADLMAFDHYFFLGIHIQ